MPNSFSLLDICQNQNTFHVACRFPPGGGSAGPVSLRDVVPRAAVVAFKCCSEEAKWQITFVCIAFRWQNVSISWLHAADAQVWHARRCRNNLIRIRFHPFARAEPLTRGLLSADPHSLCPQLNLLKPPLAKKNSWVRHWNRPHFQKRVCWTRVFRCIFFRNAIFFHSSMTDCWMSWCEIIVFIDFDADWNVSMNVINTPQYQLS
jgi:hypothetical protein